MNTSNCIIMCPDIAGIVHEITGFLFKNGANIVRLEQHIEDGMFFMRVEWEKKQFNIHTEKDFLHAFEIIQQKFDITIILDVGIKKKKIGIFCSKEAHCIIDLLGRIETGEIEIEVPYIISNTNTLEPIIKKFNIPFFYIPTTLGIIHEKDQLEIIKKYKTDVIVLARYMKILSAEFIEKANQHIINVHHSFLPSFVGAKPYEEAFDRGVKIIGATAHYVIPELDQGPIIEQSVQRINHGKDILELKRLGRESEKQAFSFAIRKHIENKLVIYKNRVIVFE